MAGYPVLYFDFNAGKYETREDLDIIINDYLCKLEKIYGTEVSEQNYFRRFAGIIEWAYKAAGKQVVILVDEYDKPLLQTMRVDEALNEEYLTTLKAFYSVLKTCGQYIRFAFLTGVTKFSKVSIFSDLNNLQDISLQSSYAGICVITERELKNTFESEIKKLSRKEHISYDEVLTVLKKKYDGYLFVKEGDSVYNPFILLNVFFANDLKDYWFAIGTPTFLVNYLKDAYFNIPDLDGNIEINESGLDTYRS